MKNKTNSVVAIFQSHDQAEAAVRELEKDGFDMKQLSIVGKDTRTEEHVMGYYNAGDRMLYWGGQGAFWGAFWGGMWAILAGSAVFAIPGVGPVLVAGPLVAWIVGVLEGGLVVGGLSALGGALASVGIPNNSIVKYETEVKDGKILLIAHGTIEDVERAKELLDGTDARSATVHTEKVAVAV